MTRPYAVSLLLWALLVRGGYVTVPKQLNLLTNMKQHLGSCFRKTGKYIANKVASLWRKLVG